MVAASFLFLFGSSYYYYGAPARVKFEWQWLRMVHDDFVKHSDREFQENANAT